MFFFQKPWQNTMSNGLLVWAFLLLSTVFSNSASADLLIKANAENKAPTVIELYTSQGCYSCPPADELLGSLAEKEDVIALSCHVTYWNYLGWKDTFSLSFCDHRQRQYQKHLVGGSRGVYTPQMIINGRYGGVGSRWQTIRGLLKADHRQQPALLSIGLTQQGQQLTITLPELNTRASYSTQSHKVQLFLLGSSGKHLLPISRGENAGKKLPYYNPIEHVKRLGDWDGKLKTIQQSLPNKPHIKEWVIFANK